MPVGWSDNYDEMGGDVDWSPERGLATDDAREVGLEKPKPLMGLLPNYGGGLCVFEAESHPGQLFMWHSEVGEIERIISPSTLDGLKRLIAAKQWQEMETELLPARGDVSGPEQA